MQGKSQGVSNCAKKNVCAVGIHSAACDHCTLQLVGVQAQTIPAVTYFESHSLYKDAHCIPNINRKKLEMT